MCALFSTTDQEFNEWLHTISVFPPLSSYKEHDFAHPFTGALMTGPELEEWSNQYYGNI